MARKMEKATIDKAIDYFVNNKVRFIDVSRKFGLSTSTLSQHLKKRGITVDSQRTRRGKPSWNKGKTKHTDSRVAKNAESLSSAKIKTGLRSGYHTVYVSDLKKRVKLHDCVWFENTGYWPNGKIGQQIHHIDGDKNNNAFDNLLLTDVKEHAQIHKQYEEIFFVLYKEGLVLFDKEKRGVDWESLKKLINALKR